MGRKPKCTDEEKVATVEDYLNLRRSVYEIMADLSVKSSQTIKLILAFSLVYFTGAGQSRLRELE